MKIATLYLLPVAGAILAAILMLMGKTELALVTAVIPYILARAIEKIIREFEK